MGRLERAKLSKENNGRPVSSAGETKEVGHQQKKKRPQSWSIRDKGSGITAR